MSQHVSELKVEILDLQEQLAELRSKQDENRSYVERMDEAEFQRRLAVSLTILLKDSGDRRIRLEVHFWKNVFL